MKFLILSFLFISAAYSRVALYEQENLFAKVEIKLLDGSALGCYVAIKYNSSTEPFTEKEVWKGMAIDIREAEAFNCEDITRMINDRIAEIGKGNKVSVDIGILDIYKDAVYYGRIRDEEFSSYHSPFRMNYTQVKKILRNIDAGIKRVD
jgi:hypothetical protein